MKSKKTLNALACTSVAKSRTVEPGTHTLCTCVQTPTWLPTCASKEQEKNTRKNNHIKKIG